MQNSKFNRWFLRILEFNPHFKYLPGKYNTIADGLSRMFEDDVENSNKSIYSFTVQNFNLDMDTVRDEQNKDAEVVAIVGIWRKESPRVQIM